MALIVTPGDPTANSYCTLQEANDYFVARTPFTAWSSATDPQKEAALLMATRLLDTNFLWNGRRWRNDQRLQWPRWGVLKEAGLASWDWISAFFNYLPEDQIPRELKEAQAEYAGKLLASDLTADLDQSVQGLTDLKVGSISLSFKDTIVAQPVPDSVELLIPYFWGVLRTEGPGVRWLERA